MPTTLENRVESSKLQENALEGESFSKESKHSNLLVRAIHSTGQRIKNSADEAILGGVEKFKEIQSTVGSSIEAGLERQNQAVKSIGKTLHNASEVIQEETRFGLESIGKTVSLAERNLAVRLSNKAKTTFHPNLSRDQKIALGEYTNAQVDEIQETLSRKADEVFALNANGGSRKEVMSATTEALNEALSSLEIADSKVWLERDVLRAKNKVATYEIGEREGVSTTIGMQSKDSIELEVTGARMQLAKVALDKTEHLATPTTLAKSKVPAVSSLEGSSSTKTTEIPEPTEAENQTALTVEEVREKLKKLKYPQLRSLNKKIGDTDSSLKVSGSNPSMDKLTQGLIENDAVASLLAMNPDLLSQSKV